MRRAIEPVFVVDNGDNYEYYGRGINWYDGVRVNQLLKMFIVLEMIETKDKYGRSTEGFFEQH